MRSIKTAANASVSEIQKPVASGSGVTCSILLSEPNVFLSGFDHDHRTRRGGQTTSALLRGKLQLNVSKKVKIKSISLMLVGKARTEWPEGIPPHKTDFFEEQTLRTQSLLFFHAMHEGMWDTEYGSQCTYTLKSSSGHGLLHSLHPTPSAASLHIPGMGRPGALTAKELKKLSLQSVNSRSFGRGESPLSNQVQAKGYKVFHPGTYQYAFELPIDHSQLETAKLQYGSVRWELQATVERAGAFKPNLHGSREVSIVRLPDQMSLEMSEPISISRPWEDQLHYDIVVSGKSFPIGGKIPIAFKLTPLAKVQLHKLKVYVTENIEYWTNDRHVTRKDQPRKLLLLEKTAGKPLDKRYATSEVRVLSGGELDPDQRQRARQAAAQRRVREAARTHRAPTPLPEPANNLLGDLDLGLESFWGSTEIEMDVQLPTCDMMAQDKSLQLHPDCSWKNVNVYHWIKIVMRISRADPDDPTGKRRRHFEISIDSPFTVLNCRATQANTSLPRYSGRDGLTPEQRRQMACGCPDAAPLSPTTSGLAGPLIMVEQDILSVPGRRLRLDSCPNHQSGTARSGTAGGARQQNDSANRGVAAAAATLNPDSAGQERERPIHLIRRPSHNPPAFDADEPPPPLPSALLTPPPQYDLIVGTPSVDGLADYFARLTAYENMARGGAGSDSGAGSETGGQSPAATAGGDGSDPTSCLASASPSLHTLARDVTADPFDNIRLPAAGEGEQRQAEANPSSHLPAPERSNMTSQRFDAAPPAPPSQPPAAHLRDNSDDAVPSIPRSSSPLSSSCGDSTETDDDDHGPARPHRRGRVNVANPRTPGGRMVPSRSLEIERPVVRLDLAGAVVRRRAGRE
ncbi:hypothetical protein VTK26DRAFT_6185 [Humicola hyalothermophila]